jgi:8-oxo-dGTP pyrophosphatase MutT (NUDIX family)
MNKEFSAGAIIFRKEKTKFLFLLIYSRRNKIWGFPKGHLEPNESEKEAALREIEEETGLRQVEFIPDFREETVYNTISKRPPFAGQVIEKHAVYFLAQNKSSEITVDKEEIADFRWLSLSRAEDTLELDNLRFLLKKAAQFIRSNIQPQAFKDV